MRQAFFLILFVSLNVSISDAQAEFNYCLRPNGTQRNQSLIKYVLERLNKTSCTEINESEISGIKSLYWKFVRGELDPTDLYGLENLDSLKLGHYFGSTHLPDEFFKYVPNLLELEFHQVSVTELSPEVLNGLSSLKRLFIVGNTAISLVNEQFKYVPGLEELVMDDGVINTIAPGAFRGLTQLKALFLENVRDVKTLDIGLFSPMHESLEILALPYAQYTSIERVLALNDFDQLKVFDITWGTIWREREGDHLAIWTQLKSLLGDRLKLE
ncbi:MAG: hypothetical protein KDD25_05885 [Bdellovibrionales bacterium]|nr:hypothetical protein [Bdellovibrionales bacterium]